MHSPFILYNPLNHGTCLLVSESNNAWYFHIVASKHITACKNFFVSLEDAPINGAQVPESLMLLMSFMLHLMCIHPIKALV